LGSRWAPRLIGAYGVSLVLAGVFRADPAGGFPPGTTDAMTWHGVLHFLAGGAGFVCLFVASLVLACRCSADGKTRWAAFSRVAGSILLLAFVALAATGGHPASVLAFAAAVVLAWGWLGAVAAHLRRTRKEHSHALPGTAEGRPARVSAAG